MSQIFVFGDSITQGKWDHEGGWVTKLKNYFSKKGFPNRKYDNFLYNLAISGNTSEDLTRRFEIEMRERVNDDLDRIILFAIGINDSHLITSTKTSKVSLERFKQNIQKLIELAKKFTTKIIFVGLTLVNETMTSPLLWRPETSYINKDIVEYNKAIQTICKKNNIDFINLMSYLRSMKYINLLFDGLHPNSEGHKKIFEIVKDYLVSHNIINSLWTYET